MLRHSADQRRPPQPIMRWTGLALLLVTIVAAAGLRGADEADSAESEPPTSAAAIPPTHAPQESATEAGAASFLNATPARDELAASDRYVTSLIQVSRHAPLSLASDGTLNSDDQWQVFCRTQLALLHSRYLLQTALRHEQVAELPLVRSQADPPVWLSDNLDVGFIDASEIMYVRLSNSLGDIDHLRRVVDAVVEAYFDDVVLGEARRRLVTRDLLAMTLDRLSKEIETKMEDVDALTKELGLATSGNSAQALQQIDIRRLERIDEELMRLEAEQLRAELRAKPIGGTPSVDREFYVQRISQLEERRASLEESISKRNQQSVDLEIRRSELEQLKRLARELTGKVEVMDIEADAPPRIRRIQQAM